MMALEKLLDQKKKHIEVQIIGKLVTGARTRD
jgi:hypothetical protein